MEEMIRIGLMNNLPEFFKQTSDAPYDRHWYKIWCTDNSVKIVESYEEVQTCLLYTSPSPRDATLSRMPSSA